MTSRAPQPTTRADQLAGVVADLVAAEGMEAVTVRRVADAAGVAIGSVQYHYRTKDDLLAGAFDRVVRDTRQRLRAVQVDGGPRATMAEALQQLLPLDAKRRREARVTLAFTARAAVSPSLQGLQRAMLRGILDELTEVVTALRPTATGDARRDAGLLLAAVDGLAQHAVSAPGLYSAAQLRSSLDRLLDAVVGHDGEPSRRG